VLEFWIDTSTSQSGGYLNGVAITTATVTPVPSPPTVTTSASYSATVVGTNPVTLTVTIGPNVTATVGTMTVNSNSITYVVSNATIGPRTVRAYQGTPPTTKSVPGKIMLTPGGGTKDLILR
jgi:hypothetical protein